MKVFFSYGHDNNARVVEDIKVALEEISKGKIKVSKDTSTLRDGGMSWRQKLTREILESDYVVGFLSEYSSRERSVCLDELAIAIGCKNGMLHTVLLEPESKIKLSSLVSEYQWLDMSDYAEHTDDYVEYINEQARKLYEILTSDSAFEYRREVKFLRGKLSQSGNSERARFAYCLKQKMFGRQWITEKLEELRIQPLNKSNRIVMLYGEPGAGKTMFSAHFQHYNPYVTAAVAFDFQSKENSDVDSVILNIAYRIAMRIPEYRTLLCYYLSDNGFDMGTGKDRFEKLIVNPLGSLNIDGEHENMYILIDALDEANGDAFATFLSNREYINMLSPWVRFLITARKEPAITERFRGYEYIDLEENRKESNEDIQAFYEYAFSYMEQDKKQLLIDRLIKVGGSNFLYASLVCEEILKDIKAGTDVFSKDYYLPLNMEELFKKTLDRKIGTEKFKKHFRKPLGMILSSPEALPLKLLSKIMDWDEEELNDFLEPFLTLLRINDKTVTVFHRSFAEWLNTTKTGYFCSKETGSKNLTLGMYENYKSETYSPDFFTLQYIARMLLDASKISEECKRAFEDTVENTSLLIDIFDLASDLKAKHEPIRPGLLYEELIYVYEYLSKSNPEQYEPYLARYLNNIGIFYYDQNKPQQAEESYLRAIEIKEKSAKLNPEQYEPDLAMSLNNIGAFYYNQNKPRQAEENYLRAIEIQERLAKLNPEQYEPDLARYLNNIGIFYKNQNKPRQAEESYLRTIEIYERLSKSNPEQYEPDLATSLNNIGVFYSDQNKPGQAEESYLRAIEIREKSAKSNPEQYEPYLANSLNNIGAFYYNQNEPRQAEESYLRAIEIRERLAKSNPEQYESDLAMSLNNIGNFYSVQNKPRQAEENYLRAIEIYEKSAKSNSEQYEPDLAMSLNNIGIFYSDQNKPRQAEESYLRAIEIRERLAKSNPEQYEPKLVQTLQNLQILYGTSNQIEKKTELEAEYAKYM